MDCAVSFGAAELRMRGCWLRQAGFEPGLTVNIRTDGPGRLIIETIGGELDRLTVKEGKS